MKKPESLWSPPPPDLNLSNNEIHVWCADLELPSHQIQKLAQVLSADERKRADRFRFERHRRRFTAARGFLRIILGRYVELDPAGLQFSYSERGKPALVPGSTREPPRFNMSHSHELALYAVARGRRIGIDIEHIRPSRDAEQLAKRFFSPYEHGVISSLSPDRKQEAFCSAWTRKEAYLKATGEGLVGLEEVEVSLAPGEPAALLSIRGNSQAACLWSVHQLSAPIPGYAAALVVEGHDCHLRCFQIENTAEGR